MSIRQTFCKYYQHIIRDRHALEKIRQYTIDNSHVWQIDQLHLNNPSKWEARSACASALRAIARHEKT